MNPPHIADLKSVLSLAIVCAFTNLAGCASPDHQSSGDFRLQSNSGKGAHLPESDSKPVSGNAGDKKRGNTPPGTDRAGSAPGSGAIIDPAGLITR